ncbi:hypothetical protein [Clostridium thermarum]|uniref:hypothetical protein n=1 Tax=Clostridium thermarum TaxID=1716543 RepID=UPI0013D8CD1D|nr:hypothetical protein [Clostridium thermarum]
MDEINNSLQPVDFEEVQKKLADYTRELQALEENFLTNLRAEEKPISDQRDLNALVKKISALELTAKQEVQKPVINLYEDLGSCQKEIAALENQQSKLSSEIYKAEDELSGLGRSVRDVEAA